MKVNLSLNTDKKHINFEGYKPVKSDMGFKEYEFNYPFDETSYDCYLELFAMTKDKNGNFSVNDKDILEDTNGTTAVKLKSGANKINLSKDYYLSKDTPFAYHYKLVKKGTDLPAYRLDAGTVINNTGHGKPHEVYNYIVPNSSSMTQGGSMKLVLPDSYNLGWVYEDKTGKIIPNKDMEKAQKSVKNFANRIGGSLAGVEKDVEDDKFKGYSRIISTPIFTDDDITAHAYWNRNCMQTALSLGNVNNYASLQKKMFAKGLNFVSDGAYVNEGLEGVHLKHILKWGEKSPYFHWFRISGLSDSPLTLGVFAKKQNNIAHRIVNPEYFYKEQNGKVVKDKKNPNWDKKKPTYFQIYDKTLVDAKKLDPQKPITDYNKSNMIDSLKINNHNDTVVPYKFEIRNDTYDKNIKALNEYNKHAPQGKKIGFNDPMAAKMLSKFETFELDEKNESGIETWDANPDIAKLNYVYSHTDTKRLKQSLGPKEKAAAILSMKESQYEVQDYAVTSGLYWTRKTNQILNLNAAQNMKNIGTKNADEILAKINQNIDKGIFPESLRKRVNKQIITNILNNEYNLKGNRQLDKDYKEFMIAGLMDVPLDSIEVGDDITAVLASPYMSKRARNSKEIGVSRFDLIKKGQHLKPEYMKTYNETNKMYKENMYLFADEILDAVNEHLPDDSKLYDAKQDTTPYGKYVIPILTAEIAKFAVIKSVDPKAKMNYDKKTGDISYNYKDLKNNTSLRSMGILADSPEQEAVQLISKLKHNMDGKISANDKKELATALLTTLQGTDFTSFAVSEMLVDRAEAGLDWRIDATKDIGDMEALRSKNTPRDYTLDTKVTDFWKHFTQSIIKENSNAYIAAEITNEMDTTEITKHFLNTTGMTTFANYRYFFNDIPSIFSKIFETGVNIQNEPNSDSDKYKYRLDRMVFEKMIGENSFLDSSPLPALLYAYNFFDNHDKPRALHCLSLDMGLFMSQNETASYESKEKAYKFLNDKFFEHVSSDDVNRFDYSRVSFKNIAMCESLRKGFLDTLNFLKEKGTITENEHHQMFDSIAKAVKDVANGKYKGENFEADAFGAKPFDVAIELILEQAKKQHNLKADDAKIKMFKDQTFETILDPAISKLLGIMKFFAALPGNPTMFAGDDLGSTGYEEKTKNIYLQNRSFLHNEWIDKKNPEYKEFIAKHKKEMDEIMSLRSRPELRALNDGAPFTLALQKAYDGSEVSALLRQSTDGAMVISLFNTKGVNHDYTQYYSPEEVRLGGINLDTVGDANNIGLRAGLKNGMIFRNANNKNETFEVVQENDHYYLRNTNNGDIVINDSTLNLYYEPKALKTPEDKSKKKDKKKPSFEGSRVLYNPQYNFVSKPYSQTNLKQTELGSKLLLTSK